MHLDLLGYLLGALSADEQRRVEDALAESPPLRQELEQLRLRLQPLDSLSDEQEPPAGLADRTVAFVQRYEEAHRPTPRSVLPSHTTNAGIDSRQGITAQPRLYSISDGIVLAMVGLTAITLLLPSMANSRYRSRKEDCQNNLRYVGHLLIDDSLRSGGNFITIPLTGNRAFDGLFAPQLVERQLLSPNTTALRCPGVERLSDASPRYVPTLVQIDNATGAELDLLQRIAGGDYAYAVGYVDEQGHYRSIRNWGRSNFPILADVPSLHLAGRQSANHGGRGQNILYEDGHIQFITRLDQLVGDDPWRNRLGHAEAGQGWDDAVLLRSEMPPILPGSDPADMATTPLHR